MRQNTSVIVPLYNKGKTIRRCLASVLQQTNKNFEIIVVDDGSEDQGPDIVRGFQDTRIRLVRQKNSGVSSARNRGIKEADNHWISFLDADDEWVPETLDYLSGALEQYPQADVAFGAMLWRKGVKTKRKPPVGWVLGEGEVMGIIEDFFVKYAEEYFVTVCAMLVRKEVFKKVGVFNERLRHGEDGELISRIAGYTDCVFVDRELMIYNRDVPGSISSRSRGDIKNLFDNEKMRRLIRESLWPSYQLFRAKRALTVAKGIVGQVELQCLGEALALVEPHLRNRTYWFVVILSKLPKPLRITIVKIIRTIKSLGRKLMGKEVF